jgi:hypothetical protein
MAVAKEGAPCSRIPRVLSLDVETGQSTHCEDLMGYSFCGLCQHPTDPQVLPLWSGLGACTCTRLRKVLLVQS